MGVTKNYELYVEDDPLTKFQDWRTRMNGSANSNISKLDTILGGKADSSRCVQATLSSQGWAGDTAPYVQTLHIAGMSAEQNGNIVVTSGASDVAIKAAADASLSIQSQNHEELVLEAARKKPMVDIPVTVILLG